MDDASLKERVHRPKSSAQASNKTSTLKKSENDSITGKNKDPLNPYEKKNPVKKRSNNKTFSFGWNLFDGLVTLLLLCAGVATRLWIIQRPNAPTNQELTTFSEVGQYLNETMFIPKQPPLFPLLEVLVAKSIYYTNQYEHINNSTAFPEMFYVSFRMVPAFCSALTIPIVYLTMRCLGNPILESISASIFVILEPALTITSRFAYRDGVSQLFAVLSVTFVIVSAYFIRNSPEWWTVIGIQSLFVGIAISLDFSNIGLLIFTSLVYSVGKGKKHYIVLYGVSLFVLFTTFYIHCGILKKSLNEEKVPIELKNSLSNLGTTSMVIKVLFKSFMTKRERANKILVEFENRRVEYQRFWATDLLTVFSSIIVIITMIGNRFAIKLQWTVFFALNGMIISQFFIGKGDGFTSSAILIFSIMNSSFVIHTEFLHKKQLKNTIFVALILLYANNFVKVYKTIFGYEQTPM